MDGCVGEDSIIVTVDADALKYKIYIPNAFTPNNDGLNDCFGIKYLGQITELKFSIYNRWGERVFYTANPSECWYGISKGQPLKSDVFIYQISATTICGKIFRKGTVMLIR
jgi:gliding motility-associated-like protein